MNNVTTKNINEAMKASVSDIDALEWDSTEEKFIIHFLDDPDEMMEYYERNVIFKSFVDKEIRNIRDIGHGFIRPDEYTQYSIYGFFWKHRGLTISFEP